MHQPGEPSVEEILDSIKKVIARDNREGAIAERRRRILNPAREEMAEPADAEEAAEVLELGVDEMVPIEDRVIQAEGFGPAADDAGDSGEDTADTLLREETRAAMQDNFAALAMLAQPGRQPQIVRAGETSLEGLVRDMLRPMLAQWLDENLPEMVEELVKAEISRIAGKRR